MNKLKVLITAKSFGKEGREPFDILERAGIKAVIRRKNEIWTEEELIGIIDEFDGIIVGADEVTRNVIEKAKKLRIISKHGVGVDNIDIGAATEKGIIVTAGLGSNTVAVAEFAVTLIMNLARNITISNNETKKGKWVRRIGSELKGKTVGIIGMGKIGKEVAKRLYGMGMDIMAYEPFKDEKFAKTYQIKYVTLDKLLQNSDFVSLHAPLMPETQNIINKDNILLMKETAYIINTARGGLIDEDSLYKALNEKRIAGAAIDVFTNEPPLHSPLLTLENVIATPHIGAYTHEAVHNMSCMAASAIADYFEGKEPAFIINR